MLRLQQRTRQIVAFHSGQDLDRVAADMQRDFFMEAEAAKAYGLIDQVIGTTPVSPGSNPVNGTAGASHN